MSYELLVGLELKDEEIYKKYREAMRPLLEKYGGGFRYDFTIAKTLRSESDKPINRVFVIFFKDRESKDAFFSHPEYLQVKEKYFNQSVSATSILSEYER